VSKTIQKPPSRQPARFVEPMQCLAVAKLPEGPDWEYEIKFDGYRALGIKAPAPSGSCPGMAMISRPAFRP
jgi:ATP-dependent DNA ligase